MTAVNLSVLQEELTLAGVPVPHGLGTADATLETVHTYDAEGVAMPLPPEADSVIAGHVAPPRVVEYAGQQDVSAITRTTDATPNEVFRFGCAVKRIYRANLRVSGVDAGNGAIMVMEGRFVWKRATGNAVLTGVDVLSDIRDTAAAAWQPNALPQATEIVFTVTGAAGRTIDWLIAGEIGTYAPEGLAPAP